MPAPSSKKSDALSMADKLKNFYRSHLETHDAPKTKSEFHEIKKMTWNDADISLPENSRSQTKSALMSVLKEKGFEVPEGVGAVKKSGATGVIEATFEGAGKRLESMIGVSPEQQQSENSNKEGFGIFQKNDGQTSGAVQQQMSQHQSSDSTVKIVKVLTDAEKASNARFLKQTMQIPKNLWVEFGIVDSEDLGEDEKPKTWSQQYDEWVESLADVCNEHGFSFPAKMELIMVGVTGVSLLILPLIMKVMGMKGDKKKDEKKKEEPNKLDELMEKENIV